MSHWMWVLTTWSRLTLWPHRTVAYQAPLSMRFPRQEYWSGLLFPPPRDLPDPEIRLMSPVSCVSCICRRILHHWATWEVSNHWVYSNRFLFFQISWSALVACKCESRWTLELIRSHKWVMSEGENHGKVDHFHLILNRQMLVNLVQCQMFDLKKKKKDRFWFFCETFTFRC